MAKMEYSETTPENIEDLKRLAKNKKSYKARIEAIETLQKYKSPQSIDILWRLMMNDKVYGVQHKAFLALQNFGEKVRLPKRKKGHLVKDINKKLGVVHKSFESNEYSLDEFIEKFQSMYPEAYDIYSYDKGNKIKVWIENILKNLPKK